MRHCSVCNYVARQDVEAALLQGDATRKVAERFGLTKSAVGRHRLNCLGPKVAAAARIVAPASTARAPIERAKAIVAGDAPTYQDALDLSGLLERIARSLERLEGAAVATAEEGLYTPLAALSGQLHKGIDTAARLQNIGAPNQPPAPGSGFSLVIKLPEVTPAAAPHTLRASERDIIEERPLTFAFRLPSERAE
jgi:hypothetical protein